MTKKFGIPTALLVTAVLTYGIWVSLPRSQYSAEAESILQRASQRDRTARELAKDATNNGYLNPNLLVVWGRKDIELKTDAEIHDTLQKVLNSCDLAQGQDTDLEGAVREKKADVLQRFQTFEKIYPLFRQSAYTQNFLVPYAEDVDGSRLIPNYLGLRKLAQACSGYAELLTLQGKSDQALEVCGHMLGFARQVGQLQGTSLSVMIRCSLQAIAQHSAAMVLDSSRPSPKALRIFAQQLRETQLDPKSLDLALETEMLMVTNTFDHPEKQADWAFPTAFPGLVAREKRIYYNQYLGLVQARAKGEKLSPPQTSEATWGDWLLGKRNFPGLNLIPNIPKTDRYLALLRKRQGFLHLVVELRLQKAATLNALKDYKPLDGFDPAQVTVSNGVAHLPIPPENDALPPSPAMQKWSKLEAAQKEWVL